MTVTVGIACLHGYGKHIADIADPPRALVVRSIDTMIAVLQLTSIVVLRRPNLLQVHHMANETLNSFSVPANLWRYPEHKILRRSISILALGHDGRCRWVIYLDDPGWDLRMQSDTLQLE